MVVCERIRFWVSVMHTTFFSPAKLCQWHSIFRLLLLCTHLLPQHDLHIERKHFRKWMEWMRLKLYSKSPNQQNLTRPCYGLCHPKLGITQVCACSIEKKLCKISKVVLFVWFMWHVYTWLCLLPFLFYILSELFVSKDETILSSVHESGQSLIVTL